MKKHVLQVFGVTLAAGVVWMASTGCERNSGSEPSGSGGASGTFLLYPSGATVGTNRTYASFNARGGVLPYRWSVANTNLGTLQGITLDTPLRVKTATYEASAGTAAGINTLRVTDARGWEATATVVHE